MRVGLFRASDGAPLPADRCERPETRTRGDHLRSVFSDDHEEREILAYRDDGIVFTYEAGSVSFGFTQTSEATYDPPMLQIPTPLEVGTKRTGSSVAKDSGGNVKRNEDWTVQILGVEQLDILGERIETWVVQIDRRSRAGGREEVTRSRKYWFDPNSAIWVKWEEKLDARMTSGRARSTTPPSSLRRSVA